MNSDQCIFSTKRNRCKLNHGESFRGIICKYHLQTIYGLQVHYQEFYRSSNQEIAGPYLIAAVGETFLPNMVIFPEKRFFDKTFLTHQSDVDYTDFSYQMNPNVHKYITDMTKDSTITEPDKRLHYELIRNLSVAEPQNITDYQENLHYLQLKLQGRLSNLQHLISNSNNNKLTTKMSLAASVNAAQTEPVAGDVSSLSEFHKFMLTNMLFSAHVLPDSRGLSSPLLPNIKYKKDIGFYVIQEFSNPMHLVVLGHEIGSKHLYSTKAVTKYTKNKNVSIAQRRDYPDSVHIFNAMTGGKPSEVNENCVPLFN